MPKYHVGCGEFGIYAGTMNPKGDTWKRKTECTNEAMKAVAQYLLQEEMGLKFNYHGKRYRLCVVQVGNGGGSGICNDR